MERFLVQVEKLLTQQVEVIAANAWDAKERVANSLGVPIGSPICKKAHITNVKNMGPAVAWEGENDELY